MTRKELDETLEFAYNLSRNRETRNHVILPDNVETKEAFFKGARKNFDLDTDQFLLFKIDENIHGWIHILFEDEIKYVQTVNFVCDKDWELCMKELLEYLKDNFSGFRLYLGVLEHLKTLKKYVDQLGFEILEETSCYFIPVKEVDEELNGLKMDYKIERVNRYNYFNFSDIHQLFEEDMYWTSEKILETLDDWVIFTVSYKEKHIGAIFMFAGRNLYEIFGVDIIDGYNKDEIRVMLFLEVIKYAKNIEIENLCYFADKDECKALEFLGLQSSFNYIGYGTIL